MMTAGGSVADVDRENQARLLGLLSQLALPMMRSHDGGPERRRKIEIEVSPDRWVEIHGVAIESHRLIMWSGLNGTRIQYTFDVADGCPRWRIEKQERGILIPEDDR